MRYAQFCFLEKGLELAFPPSFCMVCYFSYYILLTDQISLSDCLIRGVSNQTIFLHDQKVKYLENENSTFHPF